MGTVVTTFVSGNPFRELSQVGGIKVPKLKNPVLGGYTGGICCCSLSLHTRRSMHRLGAWYVIAVGSFRSI